MKGSLRSLPEGRPLCFRRWSRQRAASFHSIGQQVTIGHLRANVVERLFKKGVSGSASTAGASSPSGRVISSERSDEELRPLGENAPEASLFWCAPEEVPTQSPTSPRRGYYRYISTGEESEHPQYGCSDSSLF